LKYTRIGRSCTPPLTLQHPATHTLHFVFKAHRLLYHSTLGLSAIKKKRRHLTARQDSLPLVNWIILDIKLPGRVLPEHPTDLRLWLSGAADSGEMFWRAVHCLTRQDRTALALDLNTFNEELR